MWSGFSYFTSFCIRIAFTMAMRATPTSAKTASHRVANPLAPKISTDNLTPNVSKMFCQTTRCVCLPTNGGSHFGGLVGLDYHVGGFDGGVAA